MYQLTPRAFKVPLYVINHVLKAHPNPITDFGANRHSYIHTIHCILLLFIITYEYNLEPVKFFDKRLFAKIVNKFQGKNAKAQVFRVLNNLTYKYTHIHTNTSNIHETA